MPCLRWSISSTPSIKTPPPLARRRATRAPRPRPGRVLTGLNLDAYLGRMAVCAEAVALGRAFVDLGDDGIEMIVAVRHPPPGAKDQTISVVSPCGACRELIFDYDRKARVIVPNGRAVKA